MHFRALADIINQLACKVSCDLKALTRVFARRCTNWTGRTWVWRRQWLYTVTLCSASCRITPAPSTALASSSLRRESAFWARPSKLVSLDRLATNPLVVCSPNTKWDVVKEEKKKIYIGLSYDSVLRLSIRVLLDRGYCYISMAMELNSKSDILLRFI